MTRTDQFVRLVTTTMNAHQHALSPGDQIAALEELLIRISVRIEAVRADVVQAELERGGGA